MQTHRPIPVLERCQDLLPQLALTEQALGRMPNLFTMPAVISKAKIIFDICIQAVGQNHKGTDPNTLFALQTM